MNVLGKITSQTTLGEMMITRHKLGITMLSYDFDSTRLHPVYVTAFTATFRVVGSGATEAEATDDAIARVQHRIAEQIAQSAAARVAP